MLITLFTFLLLKYKYYIHHIITMIIYCILGIAIDAILGAFFIINLKYFYIYYICSRWCHALLLYEIYDG